MKDLFIITVLIIGLNELNNRFVEVNKTLEKMTTEIHDHKVQVRFGR